MRQLNKLIIVSCVSLLLFNSCENKQSTNIWFVCNTNDLVFYEIEATMTVSINDDGIVGNSGKNLDKLLLDSFKVRVKTFLLDYIGKISNEKFKNEINSSQLEDVALEHINSIYDEDKISLKDIVFRIKSIKQE